MYITSSSEARTTAESYVDREQPIVSLDIHPLEITHGNKTATDLNEGFDRFNPLNEALTVVDRFRNFSCTHTQDESIMTLDAALLSAMITGITVLLPVAASALRRSGLLGIVERLQVGQPEYGRFVGPPRGAQVFGWRVLQHRIRSRRCGRSGTVALSDRPTHAGPLARPKAR